LARKERRNKSLSVQFNGGGACLLNRTFAQLDGEVRRARKHAVVHTNGSDAVRVNGCRSELLTETIKFASALSRCCNFAPESRVCRRLLWLHCDQFTSISQSIGLNVGFLRSSIVAPSEVGGVRNNNGSLSAKTTVTVAIHICTIISPHDNVTVKEHFFLTRFFPRVQSSGKFTISDYTLASQSSVCQ